jgi:hypothetical protein
LTPLTRGSAGYGKKIKTQADADLHAMRHTF